MDSSTAGYAVATRERRAAVVPFLQEALAGSCPRGCGCARCGADSGFFDVALLAFLEERGLSYIIVARLTLAAQKEVRRNQGMDRHR